MLIWRWTVQYPLQKKKKKKKKGGGLGSRRVLSFEIHTFPVESVNDVLYMGSVNFK